MQFISKIIIILFLFAHPLFAENVDSLQQEKTFVGEEILVTGQRTPISFSEIGRVVKIITKEEIDQIPASSLQDLLNYTQNLDIRQRGGMDMQADISINGGSFDQVMVLLNGINMTDPQTGHYSANLPIDINNIERIEILEGAGARVYGPGAFCGAVNFITAQKKTDEVKVNLSAGQYGLASLGFNSHFSYLKIIQNNLSANFSTCDGYTQNTDFKNLNVFYSSSIGDEFNKLNLQAGISSKSFGANSFYSAKYPNQFDANTTTFAAFTLNTGRVVTTNTSVYFRRNLDRFELFRSNPPSWYKNHNYHITDVYGANFNLNVPSKIGKTTIGADARYENILSNVLGNDMPDTLKPRFKSDQFYTKSFSRTNVSLFLEHSYKRKNLNISAGVMLNYNSSLESKIDYYPGIDISYWVWEYAKLTASVNKSLRMPTFTDLFYKGPTNIGNINLKPEEAISYELSWVSLFPIFEFGVNGFYREGYNIIDWGKLPEEDVYKARNISEMNTIGLGSYIAINFSRLPGTDIFDYLKVDYLYLNQTKNSETKYISYYVLDYLKHKIGISLKHRIIKNINAVWSASYQQRMGSYILSTTGEEMEYDPFWLFNAKVNWELKQFSLFLDVSNILAQKYFYYSEVPQPERWIKIGLKYKVYSNEQSREVLINPTSTTQR
jgi:iron complex outermembrane receptor protein